MILYETQTGLKIESHGDWVIVHNAPSPNPDYNGEVTWGWSQDEGCWIEDITGVSYYTGDCSSIDELMALIEDAEATMGMWE